MSTLKRHSLRHFILGLFYASSGVWLSLALASASASDASLLVTRVPEPTGPAENAAGTLGAQVAGGLYYLAGVWAWVFPVGLIVMALGYFYSLFSPRRGGLMLSSLGLSFLAAGLAIASTLAGLNSFQWGGLPLTLGGVTGSLATEQLLRELGLFGTFTTALLAMVLGGALFQRCLRPREA